MERDRAVDLGLSREQVSEQGFLSQVYFWMAMGLLLTGFVSWWFLNTPALLSALVKSSGLILVLVIVQFGLVLWLSAATLRMSLTTATAGFSIYATLNGILFSTIFVLYTQTSIASTFLVTAGMFAAISLYGFVTKRNLSSIGSLCFMALVGLILASLVNLFLKNPLLDWVLTYFGIAIFVGLTAYDTQKLKLLHAQQYDSPGTMKKIALLGALTLYLDFINLFILLLRLLGRRR